MSFDHCVSRRDTRQSLGGFHSFQLPRDASRLLDPPTRIRGILASNPGTRELSLPSAMMEVPDSRFGDSFLLVSRRTREAYELGTGAGWRALQGDTTWVDHLAESILRLFSTEPEGGLDWASGYLYCFIDSLAAFVAHQRAGDLDVVSLDEAPDDIELRGSRYDLALARELQRVIAHNDAVLASIWGPDAP